LRAVGGDGEGMCICKTKEERCMCMMCSGDGMALYDGVWIFGALSECTIQGDIVF
jgi:hypothetical protein